MDSKIQALAQRQIYFGTSSWKYPGWRGLVYRESYSSEKEFEEKCLSEYGRIYPTVGVDHTYYAWPTPALFAKYATQTPDHFRFVPKVTEETTVLRYPKLKRYGKRAGLPNPYFLDVGYFKEMFLEPLRPFKDRLGPLLLEFSHFSTGMIGSGGDFVDRLENFFRHLDEPDFVFGVELRNANWLVKPYLEMLQRHQVCHVFNSWTHMPPLAEQLERTIDFDPPAYVARLLLRPGVKYEAAVEAYSPYDRVQDEQPELRSATAQLVQRALREKKPAYVLVNNRCEGCAPHTIQGILQKVPAPVSSTSPPAG